MIINNSRRSIEKGLKESNSHNNTINQQANNNNSMKIHTMINHNIPVRIQKPITKEANPKTTTNPILNQITLEIKIKPSLLRVIKNIKDHPNLYCLLHKMTLILTLSNNNNRRVTFISIHPQVSKIIIKLKDQQSVKGKVLKSKGN